MKIVTLDLPEEFLELCAEDKVAPEEVLRGFIADLCEIRRYAGDPREGDGYQSHGSDERMMARQYYNRVGYPYMND